MGSMFSYSKTAMERAMKVRESFCGRWRERSRDRRRQKKCRRDGLGKINKNPTFYLLRKGAISNVVKMGTFLMSVDTAPLETPQSPRDSHFSHSPYCCWYHKYEREI